MAIVTDFRSEEARGAGWRRGDVAGWVWTFTFRKVEWEVAGGGGVVADSLAGFAKDSGRHCGISAASDTGEGAFRGDAVTK